MLSSSRIAILLAILTSLAVFSGCGRKKADSPAANAPGPIVVQLDWVPEPEHGGFYQAQARGFFREAGLEVQLLPGGPNALATQKVATGRAHLAQADSTTSLLAIAQGLPIIQVAAVFQNDPSVLMLHPGNPVNRFEDLNGKTVMARVEWAFIPYVKKKYGIDFALVPQNFSTATFVANPASIQQGYYIAEPFFITQAGGPTPKYLYAWDAGFDAYAVVVANTAWAARNREPLRAFVRAYIRGWQEYIDGDPRPAHELMKRDNAKNTDAFLAFSRRMIIDEKLVIGRQEGGPHLVGRITPERIQNQIRQLEELDILPKGKVTVEKAMSTEYLPPP